MQYVNLSISILSSAEFVGSEPIDRATWLCLLRYCVIHENSGVIEACAEWADRKWQQLACVTRDEVMGRECQLWSLEGTNIVVFGYPIEQQKATIELRKRGQKAAKNRWKNTPMPSGIPSGMPHATPNGQPNGQPSGQPSGYAKDKIKKDKINPSPTPPQNRLKIGLTTPQNPHA